MTDDHSIAFNNKFLHGTIFILKLVILKTFYVFLDTISIIFAVLYSVSN